MTQIIIDFNVCANTYLSELIDVQIFCAFTNSVDVMLSIGSYSRRYSYSRLY